MTDYQRDPWIEWECEGGRELLEFITVDVSALRHRPYTHEGLRIAELAAPSLFPDGAQADPKLAGRWNRYVGWTMLCLLGVGEFVNAPDEIEGERDTRGLLPVVLLPDNAIIPPMLEVALAEPAGSPRRGEILIGVVEEERVELERWFTTGQRRREPGRAR